ncbi:muscarinic acetylcholine receptor M3-like [Lytechinus variegatus]|uniref:muscarinic acetylcholine receptor M3-like n=1 Tax=Lytechinus variegatus TaxID=7654 RepID=UPI001BB149BD|nr:muscarinic acetylcholine receptor M3-like [Lytechinus variegatus]
MDSTTFTSNTDHGRQNVTMTTQTTPATTTRATILFSIELSLSIMTVLLNALILRAYHIEKKLQTYPNRYILNITVSDMLVGFIMAIRSTTVLYNQWIFGHDLYHVFIGVQNTLLGMSVLGIIAICVDRYLATTYPLQHFQRRKRSIADIVNVITWLVSSAFWIPLVIVWNLVKPTEFTPNGRYKMNYNDNIYIVGAISVARIGIPVVLIITFYVRIHFRIKAARSQRLSGMFGRRARNTGDMHTSQSDDLDNCTSSAVRQGKKHEDGRNETTLSQFDLSLSDLKGMEFDEKSHQDTDGQENAINSQDVDSDSNQGNIKYHHDGIEDGEQYQDSSDSQVDIDTEQQNTKQHQSDDVLEDEDYKNKDFDVEQPEFSGGHLDIDTDQENTKQRLENEEVVLADFSKNLPKQKKENVPSRRDISTRTIPSKHLQPKGNKAK